MSTSVSRIDPNTANAARIFLGRLAGRYPVDHAILFGSRARHNHQVDSDADIAVVLHGPHGERTNAAIDMAGIAFDVLLDTGVLIQALPLWEDELEHPEQFSNPALIENIRREGVRL
ncbi:MAG: nucleotidyltransferase domain-containing protein [Burkholderiaceae bacterium]|nr:MAG: nucleotidyltransferase domain-containing protein [Burkholderiaceae bacterium]